MRRRAAMLIGAVMMLATTVPAHAVPSDRIAPIPGTTCEVLPANNAWHLNVKHLPVHRRSAAWKRSMHAASSRLHPDFGPPGYGIPYDVVTAGHSKVSVSFTYASESDPGPYPFGPGTTVEGGSDRHALMVDRDACTLYELYAARWNGGAPTAGSGAVFDLRSNRLRPKGWTSADAAGLPIFPGLVRWDEVRDGSVRHAIRVTASCTSAAFLWPARHQAGSDAACPPMGARFRLKHGFSMERFSADAKVVVRALKRYGLIVADNGSDWFFQGTVDAEWRVGLLDQLKSIPAASFVAVDASACRVAPNSGAFRYGRRCRGP